MPGGGDFVSFFSTRWPEFCTEISCPQGGDFDEKHYWPGGQLGGTVTGQIDTCITSTLGVPLR